MGSWNALQMATAHVSRYVSTNLNQNIYVSEPRQVGVLFGDGPIGIKLGENPLKASGVCRVYVTEVRRFEGMRG